MFSYAQREFQLRRHAFQKVGEKYVFLVIFVGYENRKTVRQNFQINRETRPFIAVHIRIKFHIVLYRNPGFLYGNNRENFRSRLQSCQKFRRFPDGAEPLEIMKKSKLNNALISSFPTFFRGYEIPETACRISEHGGNQRR